MARRLGDVEIQCDCLRSAFYGLNGDPSTLELRLKLGDEFIRIAPAGNQNERSAEATYQQGLNLVEAGRIDELVRLLDAYEGLKASRIGLHEHRVKTLRVVVALLRGEYPGLEQRIRDLREVGRKTREQDADGVYGAQMFALSRDLGSLGELAPVIERFAASPANRAWTPGLLMALVEIDRVDAVKAHLERLAADRFAEIPKDDLRATSLAFCAEACAKLGDAECARQLYELLLPHSGTFLSHPTAVCFGAAELFLGMLAATMGELADARRAFETAIKANTAARAWPWVARSCYQYARALGQSEQQDDRARANELLREAGQLADSFGMKGLAADVDRLLRGHDAGEVYPDALTAREVDVLRLIAIGRSNKDIGKVLSISLNTVATHVRNILTKTDCANRTEAAAYASRNDLIESR
jgi:DNA-binding CsgD family transcriptional regulator